MNRPGDHEPAHRTRGGQLIPFPLLRPPAGDPHETELVDLADDAGDTTTSTSPGTDLVHVGPVQDAEFVDDDSSPDGGLVRRPVVVIRQLVQPVVVVVRAERTVRTSRAVVRQLVYVLAGIVVVGRRLWEARTNSRYERMMRAAEAKGDLVLVGEWEQRGERAKHHRHLRRAAMMEMPWKLAKALVLTAAVLALMLLMLGLGLAVSNKDISQTLDPLLGVVEFIGWLAAAVAVVWAVLLIVGPFLLVGTLWHIGRTSGTTPGWVLADPAADAPSVLVTADGIVRSLQSLSIPKLDAGFKKGWVPRFDLTPTREGQGAFRGYRAIFDLPDGVTPTMVADKRDVLAVNLRRNAMEVWPSDYGQEKGGRPGFVNLYVADSGVMDRPTPTYPLMHVGSADVFEGVPIGITQRGDMVPMPLNGSNVVFGGLPGQGKSNGVRVLFAGAALDPLAELRVHVFAGNGDFDSYERRLSRYQKGASPEHAEAATVHLGELLAEVERREKRLAQLGAKKLTRQIAQQHPDMRPLVVGFSECHELFGDKENGELAADLAIRVVKRGRKAGVITVYDTQSSRANAIPSQLVENMGVNCCYSVKTWRNNDGFLGDGSFAAGIRATELRFNVDRGTMLATGLTDELFEIVRTYFIEVNDDTGWDAAAEIIARAMEQLDPQTRVSGTRPARALETSRDLLADVAEVVGAGPDPVRAADVPALLAKAFPTWTPYQRLTGKELVQQLGELGVKVPSTGNRWPIHPETVRKALTRRAES